jgi:hypothetical protein
MRLIGFKLKGFRYVFDKQIKPHLPAEYSFVDLQNVIESVLSSDMESSFGADRTSKMKDASLARLGGTYTPFAVYFSDSDCVEYVTEDAFAIYERVDSYCTSVGDDMFAR